MLRHLHAPSVRRACVAAMSTCHLGLGDAEDFVHLQKRMPATTQLEASFARPSDYVVWPTYRVLDNDGVVLDSDEAAEAAARLPRKTAKKASCALSPSPTDPSPANRWPRR